MTKRSLRLFPAVLFLAALQTAACAPEERRDIDRVADFYVERLLDSLPPDAAAPDSPQSDTLSADSTLADSARDSTRMRPLAFDSLTLDSLTADWTADDWVTFWSKVEQKQARRAEATEKAADQ